MKVRPSDRNLVNDEPQSSVSQKIFMTRLLTVVFALVVLITTYILVSYLSNDIQTQSSDDKHSYQLVKGQLLEIEVEKGMVLGHFNADVPLDIYVSGKLVCKKWVPGQSLQLPPGSQNCNMAFLPYENGTLTHQTEKED